MNVRPRLNPDEIRERILVVAEEQFRRVGYAKTAVADIAQALGMSAANIYRFFPSKSAINEAIARRLLDVQHDMVRAIVDDTTRPAADRLADVVMTIHRYNKGQFTSERRMFDMVEVAMTEHWGVVHEHLKTILAFMADLIAQGIKTGEFPPQDLHEAAMAFKECHASVLHPTLIATCLFDDDLDAQTRRLTRFALRALKSGEN